MFLSMWRCVTYMNQAGRSKVKVYKRPNGFSFAYPGFRHLEGSTCCPFTSNFKKYLIKYIQLSIGKMCNCLQMFKFYAVVPKSYRKGNTLKILLLLKIIAMN